MPIIEVRNLAKTFSVKRKEAGLRGSLKSVARPEFRQVQAVRGVTFSLEPGELLAFIGPNGAARVLGLMPWRDRRRLAYRIGSGFGQRT